ncbi:LANO_0F08658g1_1 [Lachancea nothofagi CBS 11611]|uniref:mRNA m(6)A methyltransferase n=1 Tax=Lachancea nothofagi CBS 11611 TaxID=1266666 RepID=A0A1G4K9L3_9SACH|nr:LANO_0F08658g1_1 [Lachancea nothofagi CBS 11611]
MNLELVRYFIENHATLLAPPVAGTVVNIELLFAMSQTLSRKESCQDPESSSKHETEQWNTFWSDLMDMIALSPGCVSFVTQDAPGNRGAIIDHIDVQTLQIMYDCAVPGSYTGAKGSKSSKLNYPANASLSDRLLTVLDSSAAETPNQQILSQLQRVLAVKPASHTLGQERAQKFTPHSSFIHICSNRNHSSVLSSIANVSNNKIVAIDCNKLQNADQDCPGLLKCAQSKIHFIPNLKPQTDTGLGDCSYLDTCHKLNSCRYVHYLQYVPESLVQLTSLRTRETNESCDSNKRICLYTRGLCCSVGSTPTLPAQWIQCDVRRFDFNVLGKFSVVVADPAWNIRMNLPYGTCNDSELTDLPLNLLQQEGIIFLWVTGRAIEVGKESLQRWGYQVCNEISWIKTNQLGRTIVTGRTGHWLNHSKEHLLVGLKGTPEWLNRQSDIDLIVSASRETSRKPDELYGMIERLVGPHARKLEIFGRDHNTRSGWFTIGNQLNGDSVYEPDVKRKYNTYLQRQKKTHRAPYPTLA